MKFAQALIPGTLLRRYGRFLADVQLADGQIITVHCPNSGSMLTCNEPGSPVLLSQSSNPKRKYIHTWEMIQRNGIWVGINTHLPNKIVREAIARNRVPELTGYEKIESEVRYGSNSRIDLLLRRAQEVCYVEVKNVTLVEEGVAYFPDAVTSRGLKHLRELVEMQRQGHRAVMFYLAQRADGRIFKPADHIDPAYGQGLREAVAKGVEVLVYQAKVSPRQIVLGKRLDFVL